MTAPVVFISYRWSSPEHSDWVLDLATRLRSHGVDVKLDRWDLKPGNDALSFMERMVTSEDVHKVLIISDRGYAERANLREGGVGVEAQIISPRVYEKTDQEKFAAILLELDDDSRPILPNFLIGRIYFDFTSEESQALNYEQVLRWIYGEPLDVRPPIGKKPQFMVREAGGPKSLPIISGREYSAKNSSEATRRLEEIASNLETYIRPLVGEGDQVQASYDAILAMVPLREEIYQCIRSLMQAGGREKFDTIHSFLEELLGACNFTPVNVTYSRLDNDAMLFLAREVIVGSLAIAIKVGASAEFSEILRQPFLLRIRDSITGRAVSFDQFGRHIATFKYRNEEKKLNRISLHADVIKETHDYSIVSLADYIQSDMIFYLKSLIEENLRWYPESLMWISHHGGALSIFIRAQSRAFYDRTLLHLLGINADILRATLHPYISGEKQFVRFDYNSIDVAGACNLDKLASTA